MTGKKYRSAVYKLEPNAEQERKMSLHCKASGEMFNALLDYCMEVRSTGVSFPSWYELCKVAQVKRKEFDWDGEIYANSLKIAAKNLKHGIENYFDQKKCGLNPSLPRHKRERDMNSYGYPDRVRFATDRDCPNSKRFIKLPMVGFVKYHNTFVLPGHLISTRVFRKREGTKYSWYASLKYELKTEDEPQDQNGFSKVPVGIDLGLGTLVACSDGTRINLSKSLEQYESQIAKESHRLENIPKCSVRYNKQLGRISRIYKKIRNSHQYELHVIAKSIVERYDPIFLEKLNIAKICDKSYSKDRRKHFRDASWAQLVNLILYKAADYGSTVVFVNPYNTSQVCSRCGKIVEKDETVRTHFCPFCDYVEDRDVNAARNILDIGLGLQTMANMPESQGIDNFLHGQRRESNLHESGKNMHFGGDSMQ